jgi:hypothetical protein
MRCGPEYLHRSNWTPTGCELSMISISPSDVPRGIKFACYKDEYYRAELRSWTCSEQVVYLSLGTTCVSALN